MGAKLKKLVSEYGPVALGTYLAIFALVLGGFAVAISLGLHVQSAAGTAGVLGAAWVAAKVTQPLRIAATLVLTPIVAKVLSRFRAPPPARPAP